MTIKQFQLVLASIGILLFICGMFLSMSRAEDTVSTYRGGLLVGSGIASITFSFLASLIKK